MPELPEVETIKNVIEPQIQGLTIKKATVNRPEVIAYHRGQEQRVLPGMSAGVISLHHDTAPSHPLRTFQCIIRVWCTAEFKIVSFSTL